MAGTSSQGTTFSFNGTTYTITSVSVDLGQEREWVSAAHMGLAQNAIETAYYVPHRSFGSLPTVQVEFIGNATPAINSTGPLVVAGKVAYTGGATCVSSSVTASVGDIVRGSASFRVLV